jgi:methionyl aminopeptidase
MRLRPGLVFAIEPMFTLGSPASRIMPDGWTMRTVDGSTAAHWEHTIAVTEDGPWVLSARPGEQARPSRRPSSRHGQSQPGRTLAG